MATFAPETDTGAPADRPHVTLPPLESGDHLSRPEFERRYAAMPHLKKAELIEGVVYVPSPVSYRHAGPHVDVVTWIGVYRAATPGVMAGDNATVRLDLDNEPQPDGLLAFDAACGGQVRLDEDEYIHGAPEFIAEVAASSASYDLHSKLNAYRRNGVREYLVWRVLDRAVDWFYLKEGSYERLPADAEGIYRSQVFPGLWLDAGALVRGDMPRVLAVLQQGIGTPEHAELVARLEKALRK